MAIFLFIADRLLLFHNNKLNKGENIRRIEGIPIISCSRRGKGNIAAPAIDTEKAKINITGIMLRLKILQVLYRPNTKNKLNIEHKISPEVKTNCELVPEAPNSLTILVR